MVAQQTAQAAQALHAGTIRQQLTDGEDDPNQQGQTVEQKKKLVFKKFLVADKETKVYFFRQYK